MNKTFLRIIISFTVLLCFGRPIFTEEVNELMVAPEVNVSSETPKNVTMEIEKVKDTEKLKLDVNVPKERVYDEVFQGKSKEDSPLLNYDALRKAHGNFKDKSSVRIDLVEAGSYNEPPENFVYAFKVETPSVYKGWELTVVSSAGEVLWKINGRKNPPDTILWNGRNGNGEWKAEIGDQYSFIFKGYNKDIKRNEYWEKSYKVESYMYDRGGGSIIKFSAASIFDERGTHLTERGQKLLQKVFYKLKTYKYRSGFFELRSTNMELAKFQLEEVSAFAKRNLVDLNTLVVAAAEISEGEHYFDVLLSRSAKK